MNSNRGSQWRKWDLHVHTPASFEHQFQFEDSEESKKYMDQWEKYIEKLGEIEGISVLGVTDYFTVDGYERVLNEREDGELDNFDLVLPNIEFRLATSVTTESDGKTKRINAHVILDESLEVEQIRRDFLHTIEFRDRGGNKYPLRRDKIESVGEQHRDANPEEGHLNNYEAGCKIITVDFEEIIDALEKPEFKNKYLIVLAKDGWDDVRWNTQGHLTKERLFRRSDALFSSNPKQIKWALGELDGREEFIRSFGKPTPCIWGSDAHRYEQLCNPDKNRYCWIKADPTFEGLKQVVHEPKQRVKIQEENPDRPIQIHNLDSVKIRDGEIGERLEIADQDIPLNGNLVTVIGGKGAGKTALLDLIANCFDDRWDREKEKGEDPKDRNSFIQRTQDKEPIIETTVGFRGEDVEDFQKRVEDEKFFETSDIVYLPQGKIEEYCRDEERLHEHIIELVKDSVELREEQMITRFESLEKQVRDTADRFRDKTSRIYNLNPSELRDELYDLESDKLRREGDLDSKEAEIREYEISNEDVLGDNNASSLRKKLDDIKQDISNLKGASQKTRRLTDKLERIEETNELLEELEEELEELSQDISLSRIPVTPIADELNDAEAQLDNELQEKEERRDEIRKELDEMDDVERKYSDLLDEKEAIETDIQRIEGKIANVKGDLNEVEELRQGRREDYVEYVTKYNKLENQYQTVIDEFSGDSSNGLEDISFEPSIRVKDDLWNQMERVLDMRRANDEEIQELVDALRLATEEDVNEKIREQVLKFLDLAAELRNKTTEGTQDVEFESSLFDRYLTLNEDIYFRGSPMPNLSLGQKGTVLLKILLEESDDPLIIDQPEENLDNEFIYETLVGAFRDAKLHRQVIIATHNANMVVNTDTEQVIVARFEDNIIDFRSGALENEDIRSDITTILEGGEEAFRKREQRYEIPETYERV